MNNLLTIEDDKILRQIALELMFSNPQNRQYPSGLTAIEISRKHKIKIDVVKKKLKALFERKIIRCIGANPKFWVFDEYEFQRIDESDPIYLLLCNLEDVDFDDFFTY